MPDFLAITFLLQVLNKYVTTLQTVFSHHRLLFLFSSFSKQNKIFPWYKSTVIKPGFCADIGTVYTARQEVLVLSGFHLYVLIPN